MTVENATPEPPADPVSRTLTRRAVLRRGGLAVAGTAAGGVAVNAATPHVLREVVAVDPNQSYWADVLPPPGPRLATDLDVDVVIIGGGLTGLSTAYYLRHQAPERRVVVLEAHRCGNGASARNGAMLLTMTPDRWLQAGDDAALDRRLLKLTTDNIATLGDLATKFEVDLELETRGAARVLRSSKDVREGRESASRLSGEGLPVTFWDAARVRDALGTSVYAGALFDSASGQLHPGRLVELLRRAAIASGAEIYEETPVIAVEEGPVHRIETGVGRHVRAPVLVVATNAYSSQLGYLRNAYVPIVATVAITSPIAADVLGQIGWNSRVPFDDDRIDEYWLGITRDGRIHIGGGPLGYDYGFNNGMPTAPVPGARAAALAAELERIHPALAPVRFERCWSGAVDCSLDFSASVGRAGRHDNVYYAIGYSGHGVNLTSVFGRVLADLATGRDELWTWLPYLNRRLPYLPNEPFRWLGVRALRAAVGMVDR